MNGVCTNGACVCDKGWEGTTCNTMKFARAPAGGAYGYSPNVTAWGGMPVQVGDTYHLLNTEIINHCGLCTWGQNSRVIHATSTNLLGPYTFKNEALPVWSHNPHITVDRSSGSPVYLLFHIGAADGGNAPKNGGSVIGFTGNPITDPLASGVLHTATDPAGPWTPQNPPGLGGCNNPAPWVFPNGTIFLMCSQGGNNMYTASSWKGPWTGRQLIWSGDAGATSIWEDPFIWHDQRGFWKMIAHVYPQTGSSKNFWDRVSGYGYSLDGLHWTRFPWQPYTNEVEHSDGTTTAYTTRERPKIFFDPRDDITPLALFTGVARGTNCYDCKQQCGVDWTFNLAQAFAV